MRAELLLYDVIGEDFWTGAGMTGRRFAEELEALGLRTGDELVLRVNCPGGFVFDGLAIYNQLLELSRKGGVMVTARVEGLAASAASFVIQAANRIEVAKASFVMIHRAWGLTVGNAEDHLEAAQFLEKNDGVLADIYADRSKRPAAEMLALMSAESWFTGTEAVEAKLADGLIPETVAQKEPEEQAAAALASAPKPLKFRNTPSRLTERIAAHVGPWPSGNTLRSPVRLQPAALVTSPRAKGAVLNAENKKRLNDIRDLAQEVLDSAEPKESEESEDRSASARRTLVAMEIETSLAQAGMEAACP